MQPTFSIKEAISFGWNKTIDNLGFLVLLTLVLMVASSLFDNAISALIGYFAMFIFVRTGLAVYKGEKLTVKGVFAFSWKSLGFYLLASLIVLVATVIGYVLLIIPGIYLTIRLGFYSFSLIEENLKPVDAIKRSWHMTKGYFWKLLGLSALIALINLGGALIFGVGLLITVPLSIIAQVYAFQKLRGAPEVISTATPEAPSTEIPATPAAPVA